MSEPQVELEEPFTPSGDFIKTWGGVHLMKNGTGGIFSDPSSAL